MMLLALNKYLAVLREKSQQFERTDINGRIYISKYKIFVLKIFLIGLSLFISFFLKSGLPNNFVSYLSTTLSIFVGLFITALIFSFDKFYMTPEMQEDGSSPSVREETISKQSFNFIRQFAYVTGYTIVLSIFSILILVIYTLFEEWFKLDLTILAFESIEHIDMDEFILFIRAILCLIQRTLIFYWLIRILYNTLFIVSGLVIHMIEKINRNDPF